MACRPTATGRASCNSAGNDWRLPLVDLLPVPKDYRDFYAALTGKNLRLCPECGLGTMVRIELLPPCQSAVGLRMDSS
jgi:hypothetical protein